MSNEKKVVVELLGQEETTVEKISKEFITKSGKGICFPLLEPKDIEVRIATIQEGKTKLLLYQNSRTTMDALDSTVGAFNWKIEYYDCCGQTFGRLSIFDSVKNQWVCKSDTGEESNIAEKKGLSSDILKRCAVRFGFARELYSAPNITVKSDDKYMKYYVHSISYNEKREIIQLSIVNRKGEIVFDWQNMTTAKKVENTPPKTAEECLIEFCKEKKNTETDKERLKKYYKYYEQKCKVWKGVFNAELLYQKWCDYAKQNS